MIALSLYLPEFPTDLARKRAKLDPKVPVLLSRDEHQREIVAACCTRAHKHGVHVGMTVSQAKALLPSILHHEEWDGSLLKRAIRKLAHHALRFTPLVMPDDDGLWLDCAGCPHLFGGMRKMAARVGQYFTGMGFASRIGVAPNMGAAWALARHAAEPLTIVEQAELPAKLARLPIEALRLGSDEVEGLHAVGVTTIAEIVNIPRHSLAERFGANVVRRLDHAFGREPESLEPVRSRPPLHVGRAFAGPTDRPESIALAVEHLLAAIAAKLGKREAGCRELLVILRRSDLPPVELIARASMPTRDAKHWYTLLRSQLERAHLGFGVEGVEIMARGVTVLTHQQATRWIDNRSTSDSHGIARLADTLKARLGDHRVHRMKPRASHTPERSWVAAASETFDIEAAAVHAPQLDRPTLLLPHPVPIDAVFLFPEGPIGSLTVSGEVRRIVRCRGPERLCGEWWRRDKASRDYYQLQTENGAWLWVFRSVESGRWFLHGEWA